MNCRELLRHEGVIDLDAFVFLTFAVAAHRHASQIHNQLSLPQHYGGSNFQACNNARNASGLLVGVGAPA